MKNKDRAVVTEVFSGGWYWSPENGAPYQDIHMNLYRTDHVTAMGYIESKFDVKIKSANTTLEFDDGACSVQGFRALSDYFAQMAIVMEQCQTPLDYHNQPSTNQYRSGYGRLKKGFSTQEKMVSDTRTLEDKARREALLEKMQAYVGMYGIDSVDLYAHKIYSKISKIVEGIDAEFMDTPKNCVPFVFQYQLVPAEKILLQDVDFALKALNTMGNYPRAFYGFGMNDTALETHYTFDAATHTFTAVVTHEKFNG